MMDGEGEGAIYVAGGLLLLAGLAYVLTRPSPKAVGAAPSKAPAPATGGAASGSADTTDAGGGTTDFGKLAGYSPGT
jgi:hypothetical protein